MALFGSKKKKNKKKKSSSSGAPTSPDMFDLAPMWQQITTLRDQVAAADVTKQLLEQRVNDLQAEMEKTRSGAPAAPRTLAPPDPHAAPAEADPALVPAGPPISLDHLKDLAEQALAAAEVARSAAKTAREESEHTKAEAALTVDRALAESSTAGRLAAERAVEAAMAGLQAAQQAVAATSTATEPGGAVDPAVLTDLNAQIAQLAERISANAQESRKVHELIAAVDARITQLGSELALQIDELAGEVDAVARQAPRDGGDGPVITAEVDPAVLAELRHSQERLAAEQARYEIAFRQDLAELADQVLRRKP